jgi:hypothetical protein
MIDHTIFRVAGAVRFKALDIAALAPLRCTPCFEERFDHRLIVDLGHRDVAVHDGNRGKTVCHATA